jgi:AraC-like DNA-binding protein
MISREQLLRHYVCLETTDPDHLSDTLTRLLGVHRIEPLKTGMGFAACLSAISLTDVSLACLTFNSAAVAQASAGDSTYMIRTRSRGKSEARFLRKTLEVSPECSAVFSPEEVAQVFISEKANGLGLRIKESAIAREFEHSLGHLLGATIRFDPEMSMRTALGQTLSDEVTQLCNELDANVSSDFARSLAVRQREKDLISMLIIGQPHNYTRLLHRQLAAGSWQVRVVEEYIRAHADESISLGDLCAIAGVNARTIQFSFHKYRGCSPMQFLRRTRLEAVRSELLSSEGQATVSDIAMKWGFLHLGRFAAEYTKQFGELPSASLRRSKV